jgi:cobalamin-dependent methionine synthase I
VLESIISALIVSSDAPNLLVATPSGDRHEIEAVMAAAVAAAEGWRVTYLGPGVPAGDIASAALNTGAHAVGMTVAQVANGDRMLGELRALRTQLSATVPLLVGGAGAIALAPALRRTGIQVIEDIHDLRVALQTAGELALV